MRYIYMLNYEQTFYHKKNKQASIRERDKL